MEVVIIGSGNVATVLGHRIISAGHRILQVFSRSSENGSLLATALNCAYASAWDQVSDQGDLYLVALSDNALSTLDGFLSLDKRLVVHTSGSVSIDILKKVSRNYGVLYPLQSLRKENPGIASIPFLVDGNTREDLLLIHDFADSLSDHVKQAGDKERSVLHLAATLVNNFSNFLYTTAEKYCAEQNTDFRLLIPLIEETAARLNYFSPAAVQTGPAMRGDTHTINKHLEMLAHHPALQSLYLRFTDEITNFYRST